jgi:hypothetical protein
MLAAQRRDVDLDVPGHRMAGRQVFGLDQRGTLRAVVLNDLHPAGIAGEVELLVRPEGKMDLARITRPAQATELVAVVRGAARARARSCPQRWHIQRSVAMSMPRYSVTWISMRYSSVS